MSKTVVIYKSTYGTTKAYAQWIAKKLDADLLECTQLSLTRLQVYGTIIYGGGIYAGGIAGVEFIRKNYTQLDSKHLIVFSVGFTPIVRKDILKKVIEKHFNDIQQKHIQFFHFPGTVDYNILNPLHRTMLLGKKLIISLKSKDKLSQENKKFLTTYGQKPLALPFELVQPLIKLALTK